MQWPHTLYLQADNASDNKNFVMYALCQLLRDKGIFKKVKLSFLPVGHTHEDVDACFGALSRQLATHDAVTIADVEKIWRTAWPSLKWFKYLDVGISLHFIVLSCFRFEHISYDFQEKLDLKTWIDPFRNNSLKGIKYPSCIVWKWKDQNREKKPLISWKCNM